MVTQEETKQLNRQTSTIATFDRRIVSVALHKITILKNWKGKRDKWKCQAVRMFSINESYKNTLHLTAVWILIIPTARDSCLFVITEFKVAPFERDNNQLWLGSSNMWIIKRSWINKRLKKRSIVTRCLAPWAFYFVFTSNNGDCSSTWSKCKPVSCGFHLSQSLYKLRIGGSQTTKCGSLF